MEGHKLDNIKSNDNVCFETDEIVSVHQNENPCSMSTNYKSVVMFGKASIVTDEDQRLNILKKIVDKYSDDKSVSSRITRDSIAFTTIIEIKPDIITGKKSIK